MESMKEALSRDSFKNLYSNFSDDISARIQDNNMKQRFISNWCMHFKTLFQEISSIPLMVAGLTEKSSINIDNFLRS